MTQPSTVRTIHMGETEEKEELSQELPNGGSDMEVVDASAAPVPHQESSLPNLTTDEAKPNTPTEPTALAPDKFSTPNALDKKNGFNDVEMAEAEAEAEESEFPEDGTLAQQAAFMKELENFHREKALEFKAPKFYGEPLNCLKLWRAVIRLGGYELVTASKLWRQVGESFHPPKTCTTVSWTFRIFYEKALLRGNAQRKYGRSLVVLLTPKPQTPLFIIFIDCLFVAVPSDTHYSDVEMKCDEIVVCSVIRPHEHPIPVPVPWCKIIRNSDFNSATLHNISSNTILADDALIQTEDTVVINCGTEIIPGPQRQGYLSYRFKLMPTPPQTSQKQLKICMDVDHAKCSICLSVWHDVVTIAPCFHNFCNGCFSEWLRRSQEKHSNILCPQCRAVVQFAGRNHFLHNIAQDILQADSSLGRSNDELASLDSYATIRSNLVIKSGKKLRQKRSYSQMDEESHSVDLPCPQCAAGFHGFRCNDNTIHLQCQACGGMMPSRPNTTVVQHCLGCDRAFCGAYWHSQSVLGTDSHAMCSPESFKPISERTISRIPFLAHEKNRHEQDITEKCIRQAGRTLQDVVAEWITKLNNREIDRTRMPLNHAEMITAGTHLCNDCYDKLVSFLLYWYRISTPKYLLPPDASAREDCWYGYGCRTQHHNEEHARKRNHVCRPTRGSNM